MKKSKLGFLIAFAAGTAVALKIRVNRSKGKITKELPDTTKK